MHTSTREKPKPVPWEGVITSIQEHALLALGRYMYLTLSQLLELNIGTSQYTYLWKQMASLRDRKAPLINCTPFAIPQPRKGRVESLYSLSSFGKNILINDFGIPESQIRAPIGKQVAYKDYQHRKFTIDFHIALDQWCNQIGDQILLFETYFDKIGNNRTGKDLRAKTKVDLMMGSFIIPDAVFVLEGSMEPELFLFEMHNGKDTKRMLNQLHHHAEAMVSRAVHKQYGYDQDKRYHILYLFEFTSALEAAIDRAKADVSFSMIQDFILLKSVEELKKYPFSEGWRTLYGKPATIFQRRK